MFGRKLFLIPRRGSIFTLLHPDLFGSLVSAPVACIILSQAHAYDSRLGVGLLFFLLWIRVLVPVDRSPVVSVATAATPQEVAASLQQHNSTQHSFTDASIHIRHVCQGFRYPSHPCYHHLPAYRGLPRGWLWMRFADQYLAHHVSL